MSIDVENQLREAFSELSDSTPDVATTTDRAMARAKGLRRRRAALIGGGATAAVAAVAAVVAAGLVGTALPSGTATRQLHPAASSASSAQPTPDVTVTSIAPGNGPVDEQHLFQGKRIAGVGGYLLPHGRQLPKGLRYEDAHRKTYAISQLNAGTDVVFLSRGLGSDVPGADQSAPDNFGRVATAWGLASNHTSSGTDYGDGDPRQRAVNANVTRFKSADYAATAIAKAKAKTGPIIWFASKTKPLTWSGVSGAQGEHHLYDLGTFGVQEDYLAIQVIGPFIVSADSADPSMSTRAVTSMVANLRAAKLVN